MNGRGGAPSPAAPGGVATAANPEAASGHPRSARREATRQRVLDAAREVFAERGVLGATVEDICERAGYTRGAFYSNFADKDEVLEALIEREQARLLGHLDATFGLMEEEIGAAPEPGAAMAPIVERILGSIPMDRQLLLVQTEMEIHAIRFAASSGPFRAAEAHFRERIAGFIREAMTRYDLELLVEPGVLADACLGVMERSVRRSLLSADGTDTDAIARQVLPLLLAAVSRRATG